MNGMSVIDLVNGLGSHKCGCTVAIVNEIDDTQFSYLVTWDDVLNGKTDGLQVWSRIHQLREPLKKFTNARKNEKNLLQLLHYLYEECYGDKIQSLLLVTRYYQALNKFKQQQLKAVTDKVDECQPVSLIGEQFTLFMNKIDNLFKNEMFKCYSSFRSITQPIVSKKQMNELVLEYKTCLPSHYKLMNTLFGYKLKENMVRRYHLKESGYYTRLLFFQFQLLSQARIRNCHNSTYWGMLGAGAMYGRGLGQSVAGPSSFFRHSTTVKTFLKNIKQWRLDMPI